MEELQELRNEILTLRNYGVINKEEEKSLLNKLNTIKEQLRIGGVSQQRELLGCNHDQIRIDGNDIGTCVKCGKKMVKAWQPNCG